MSPLWRNKLFTSGNKEKLIQLFICEEMTRLRVPYCGRIGQHTFSVVFICSVLWVAPPIPGRGFSYWSLSPFTELHLWLFFLPRSLPYITWALNFLFLPCSSPPAPLPFWASFLLQPLSPPPSLIPHSGLCYTSSQPFSSSVFQEAHPWPAYLGEVKHLRAKFLSCRPLAASLMALVRF